MPFLNDQELEDLQQQINDLNSKNEDLENELSEKIEEVADVKSVSRNRNIILSFLTGISLALAYFAYQGKFGGPASKTSAINKEEMNRIIDSVKTAYSDNYQEEGYDDEYSDDESATGDGKISSIKDGLRGKTVYSVQIGAFTEKRYPLLSKTIAGTLSDEDYLRYSIGLFETLKEAQDFRKQIVNYGFNDAFVASYLNGRRKQIHKPY
ncbi:hypothetical protein [uncultured Tenacibaculum sp.]|uniref:hypothetical protein n=1 Tax=uncultured Tenacibaculum sp. TaxID=174713 RepID=UPI0026142B9C|nr:hypothetical protein [uncultured Tenacibaculum sp.]